MKILLVEDNSELLLQLQELLSQQRYLVDTAATGTAALDKIFAESYDLILLDIMLPEVDGLTILKELRQARIVTPVLLLTAMNSVTDRVKGLDYGADDYLDKPFSIAELMARIRALLRRSGRECDTLLSSGDVVLDTVRRQVTRKSETLELTLKEFSLLEFLLYNKNRPVSRITLAEHVWGDDFDPFTMSNTIDVHIKNLRHKLDLPGAVQSIIKTVRGVGYVIDETAGKKS
jgi:DNA-binding response OmpR family regulator